METTNKKLLKFPETDASMVFLNSLMIKPRVARHTNVSYFADISKEEEMLSRFSVPVVFICFYCGFQITRA